MHQQKRKKGGTAVYDNRNNKKGGEEKKKTCTLILDPFFPFYRGKNTDKIDHFCSASSYPLFKKAWNVKVE